MEPAELLRPSRGARLLTEGRRELIRGMRGDVIGFLTLHICCAAMSHSQCTEKDDAYVSWISYDCSIAFIAVLHL